MNLFRCVSNLLSAVFDPLIINRVKPAVKNPKRLDLSGFELTFEDAFDGDGLDETKWHEHRYFNRATGARKGGFWSPSQAKIIDNRLHIRAEYKKDGEFGEGYYTEAIDTSGLFEQKFGYFECRCRLPAAEGLWAAFWLYPKGFLKDKDCKDGTEIDVFESPLYKRKGMRNAVVSNLHYKGRLTKVKSKRLGAFGVEAPYDSFNTYGVEWNEREYIFYINGVEVCRYSEKAVSQRPQFMILSVEVDGVDGKPLSGWSGNVKNNPEGTLPVDFVVDYVRAYKYKNGSGT